MKQDDIILLGSLLLFGGVVWLTFKPDTARASQRGAGNVVPSTGALSGFEVNPWAGGIGSSVTNSGYSSLFGVVDGNGYS